MTVMTVIICILFTKVHGDRWDCKNWANSTALGEVIINSVFDRKVVIYSGTRKKERRVKSKSTPQPFQEYTTLNLAWDRLSVCRRLHSTPMPTGARLGNKFVSWSFWSNPTWAVKRIHGARILIIPVLVGQNRGSSGCMYACTINDGCIITV